MIAHKYAGKTENIPHLAFSIYKQIIKQIYNIIANKMLDKYYALVSNQSIQIQIVLKVWSVLYLE